VTANARLAATQNQIDGVDEEQLQRNWDTGKPQGAYFTAEIGNAQATMEKWNKRGGIQGSE
jgi:hypothetical protein